MEQTHKFLKIFFFVQLGACAGRVLAQYLHYVRYPGIYELQSAPWYTGITLTLLLTAVTAGLTALAWWLVGQKLKKQGQSGQNPEQPHP